nr:hypothetical protein [Sphingomonas sp.]
MLAEFPLVLPGGRAPTRLSSQLSRAASVMLVLVAVLSIVGIFWSTRQSDEVSVERQVRVAHHSIDIALDELALQQETVAVWDESAEQMVGPAPDRQWLFDNVGLWLHRIFAHDEGFLLDGRDRLVEGFDEGKLAPAGRYRALRPQLDPLLNLLRGRIRGQAGRHDRLPGVALALDASVRTTVRAVHVTRLMMVGGRPAAASAMLIEPSTEGYVRPNPQWPVLISIRYL